MASGIEEKIAKLLALAEATTNPAEAEAFTEKAETLMLQYGIEQAQVDAALPKDKQEEILIEHLFFDSAFYQPLSGLGAAVAPAFNIKGYLSDAGNKKIHIWLVGHKSDIEQAAILVRSLVVQAEAAAGHWWKKEGDKSLTTWNQFVQKRQFLFGFVRGVRERLDELRIRVVSEAGSGTELVLADRGQLVNAFVKDNMRFKKGKGSSVRAGEIQAGIAGVVAGRESVGQRSITS